MFDGVGSVYHIIKKKLGKPPAVYIAAEQDPVLRRLVAAELGLREDQRWGYTVDGVVTIYVRDVWDLLGQNSLILRQAKAMYPNINWLLIAGSPCQDLTYAGYLNGLLGLTGNRSMLFFVVYVVLSQLQTLFGFNSVRFLTENAGSMQTVENKRKPNSGPQLEQSEHFQLFLYCLGLPTNVPANAWLWDTGPYYGIRRQRVFLRSHMDTAIPPTRPVPGDEVWGPLVSLANEHVVLAPLLRTREYTQGGAVRLSWTGYQPTALLWDYSFVGGKRSFALLCQLANNEKVPKLLWASIIPAHFLPIWNNFLATLHATNAVSKKRDEFIEQLVPIFHNPNIALPMRILQVQEVRKLAGLESILTVDRHGTKILTEKNTRDFCGNSFHPDLIDAALGSDEQFQGWVCGTNDAQPCHTAAPQQQEVYGRYQQLLRQVLKQGSVRGVQLKADRVDFEAKWRHHTLGEHEQTTVLPDIRQPTFFSFLQTAKAATKASKQEADRIPFGDQEFASALRSVKMDWLLPTAVTYENVPLSARMLMLAVGNGVGLQVSQQEVKKKYVELFQEYLREDKLCAIHQLATVLQIATLGSTHRFPFGFIVWAPKFTQPPLLYVGAHKPCLLFLLLARETDQPFLFGTAAYDYLQQTDFMINSQITQIKADVVQLTHCVFTTTPFVVRIDEGKHFLHLSEFAAINTPFCAMCFLSILGAKPCFVHAYVTTTKVTHLVGGLEGTGHGDVDRKVFINVHVDDILLICKPEDVPWFQQTIGATLKMKVDGPHLLGSGDQMMYLKKRITMKEDGILIQPNATYVPKLTSLLKVTGRRKKGLPYHATLESFSADLAVDAENLAGEQAAMFRSGLGLTLYVAMDRPDIQFAVKTLSSYMSRPSTKAMAALKHLASYLDGTPDNGVLLRMTEEGKTVGDFWNEDMLISDEVTIPDLHTESKFTLEAFSDSSWADCKATRRSTSSGIIFLNGCMVMSVCRTQASVSLSSCEAELYAANGLMVESIYLYRLCKFLCGDECENNSEKVQQRLFLDSSSALGLGQAD